jgi:hypothetical protein
MKSLIWQRQHKSEIGALRNLALYVAQRRPNPKGQAGRPPHFFMGA